VFQTFVDQHVDFEPVSPQSVATLRLTTVHEGGGKVSVRQAFMRVGRVDDLHVKSTSSLRIGVDVDVGRFHPTGYTKTWATMEKHPDTGAVFGDHSVPGFDACRRLVEELHAQVPHVTCVGWDLAVDRDAQPVLLEWNGTHNGIKFSEAVQGPCFLGLGWETLWRQRPADA